MTRRAAWSGALTDWLTRSIPPPRRPAALAAIKGFHTAIFFSVAGMIALFAWDGLGGGPRRRTVVAAGVALAESVIYVSNNQVCPLTPLAEELGAESGSVVDIFLPDWLARRIPLLGTTLLVLGLALHLRALAKRRTAYCADGVQRGRTAAEDGTALRRGADRT